jgi:hypothetical protein|tara:strand:- start:519 stop:701 length:183 start_codon:yes stop_codon:yes gene_type:complete
MEANIYKIKSKQFKAFNGMTIKALNPKEAKQEFKNLVQLETNEVVKNNQFKITLKYARVN